jgi:hypothetical protein
MIDSSPGSSLAAAAAYCRGGFHVKWDTLYFPLKRNTWAYSIGASDEVSIKVNAEEMGNNYIS